VKTTKEIVKQNMSLFNKDACKIYDDNLKWYSEEEIKEKISKIDVQMGISEESLLNILLGDEE